MYISAESIDLNSLEFVALHIYRYRKISNLTVNLNGRYFCSFEKNVMDINKNDSFVNLFEEYGINLKVLCGKNGVGKTTIINILHNKIRDAKFFIIFKDKDDIFMSNENVKINYNSTKIQLHNRYVIDHLSEICCSSAERSVEDLSIHKKLAYAYSKMPELYDNGTEQTFSGFDIRFWDMPNNIDAIVNHIRPHLSVDIMSHELSDIIEKSPLLYFFFDCSQDNTFDRFWNTLNIADQKQPEQLHLANLISIVQKLLGKGYSRLNNKLIDIIYDSRAKTNYKEYKFNEFNDINDKLHALSKECENLINKALNPLNPYIHIEPHFLMQLLVFKPFKKINRVNRYWEDLSSGEKTDLWNRYSLYPAMAQEDGIWHYEDEPDIHLHPEWKRKFISKYLEAIKQVRSVLSKSNDKLKTKIYNIIITTHSPFILSDLPKENVEFLDFDKCDNTIVHTDVSNTFAGNIGEMFYSNFFMHETIGDFAKGIIKNKLKQIEHGITTMQRDEIAKIFALVGDELLRNLLLDRLGNARVINEKD